MNRVMLSWVVVVLSGLSVVAGAVESGPITSDEWLAITQEMERVESRSARGGVAEYAEQIREELAELLPELAALEEECAVDPEVEDYWEAPAGEGDTLEWYFLDGVFELPCSAFDFVMPLPVHCEARTFRVVMRSGEWVSVRHWMPKEYVGEYCDFKRRLLRSRFDGAARHDDSNDAVAPNFDRLFPWRHDLDYRLHVRNTPLGHTDFESMSLGKLMVLRELVADKLSSGEHLLKSMPLRTAHVRGLYWYQDAPAGFDAGLWTTDSNIEVELRASDACDGERVFEFVRKMIGSYRPHGSRAPGQEMMARGQAYLEAGKGRLAYSALAAAEQYEMDAEATARLAQLRRESMAVWLEQAEGRGSQARRNILAMCRWRYGLAYGADDPLARFVRGALTDRDAEVRRAAYDALGRGMGHGYVPLEQGDLLRGLEDASWRVRSLVVERVGDRLLSEDDRESVDAAAVRENDAMVERLVDVVCNDPCTVVRLGGMDMLVSHAEGSAKEALAAVADDEDELVREAAGLGLQCVSARELRKRISRGDFKGGPLPPLPPGLSVGMTPPSLPGGPMGELPPLPGGGLRKGPCSAFHDLIMTSCR